VLLAAACLAGGVFRLACSAVLASGSWDGNGRDLAGTDEMHYEYCRNPMVCLGFVHF